MTSKLRKMTFNFSSPDIADQLAMLAELFAKTKTQVVCDLITREFDSVMVTTAINSVKKELNETVS
jgi:hypothetical protein